MEQPSSASLRFDGDPDEECRRLAVRTTEWDFTVSQKLGINTTHVGTKFRWDGVIEWPPGLQGLSTTATVERCVDRTSPHLDKEIGRDLLHAESGIGQLVKGLPWDRPKFWFRFYCQDLAYKALIEQFQTS